MYMFIYYMDGIILMTVIDFCICLLKNPMKWKCYMDDYDC